MFGEWACPVRVRAPARYPLSRTRLPPLRGRVVDHFSFAINLAWSLLLDHLLSLLPVCSYIHALPVSASVAGGPEDTPTLRP
jgi:hypothetical protein